MSIIHLSAVGDDEPTPADLDGIEREWPLLAAELEAGRGKVPAEQIWQIAPISISL